MSQGICEASQNTQNVSRRRNTLAGEASLSGRGVHSGIPARLTIRPAPPGTGLQFVRTDLPGKPTIPVSYAHLASEELDRRTTLRTAEAAVHTIEHALSAMMAMDIDDAYMDVDAAEPPFADGSSKPFVELICEAGITEISNSSIEPITIPRPLVFLCNDSEISAIPSDDFRVSFFFNSDHPNLRTQSQTFVVTPDIYREEIAPARTFCFFEEIEMLRRANLIKGANLSSAVVIGRKGILNETLRFPDEPVRHKILDFIGDMALLGAPLKGHFLVWRGGHRVNAAFGKYLIKELNL